MQTNTNVPLRNAIMVQFSVYAEIDDTIRVNYLKMVIEVKMVQGRTLVYIIGPSKECALLGWHSSK